MAGVDLNLSGAVRRTNKGSVDFYYGGGDEAWANLAAAYAGIPSVIRNGKVFGVITAGVISEYWWNDASQLADGDEVPYAQGGTTLTPDQVDAIDNANSPNSGNPFATMADILAGVVYQGVWNATTNTPTLTSSVGTQGYYYVVSVAGTTNLNGITDWEIGDWAIFNGAVWQKVDNTDVTGGNANITSINVATLQALQTGSTISTTTFYNVTNAVGSTRVLQVYAIANNTNVVWAVDVTTGEIGTYDITGDVFVGGSGVYTPTLTPDGFVCTAATVSDSEYLANSNKMTIGIDITGIFDFTAGNDAEIEFDLPYGTLVSSRGTVSINIGTETPTQPVYGYVRNHIIHVLCNDNTFTVASMGIYATVIVDFTP